VDENYLRESLLEPMKKVVAGYAPQMPVIPGIKEKQIAGLIEYIKSLRGPNQ
jgi:cytochrome c oxidase subunit 2